MIVAFIKTYVLTLIPFMVLDALWLGMVAPKFYKKHIGFIMAENPNWAAAALFYLIFIAGLVVFVTFREVSLLQAALRGAMFGLVCYATYDLTNLATLKDWPITVTMVDLAWGTFLCATTAVAAVLLERVL